MYFNSVELFWYIFIGKLSFFNPPKDENKDLKKMKMFQQ
jgi:hypothetical protein